MEALVVLGVNVNSLTQRIEDDAFSNAKNIIM